MRRNDDPQHLMLAEETLSVDNRSIVTGRVRVRSETDTVETTARADLQGEALEVTRVPVDRPVNRLLKKCRGQL